MDGNAGIDSESPPVPAQDVDNTMEQGTDLKETCLSSQGVSTETPNLNETVVIASETAGRDIVSSPLTIPENLGYAQVAMKLEESAVQQEPTLTSKSSIETTSMAKAAAKIGEPLSSHLIVDSNGISNATHNSKNMKRIWKFYESQTTPTERKCYEK